MTEEVVSEGEKIPNAEKPAGEEVPAGEGDKEGAATEVEEKEPEDKVKKHLAIFSTEATSLFMKL